MRLRKETDDLQNEEINVMAQVSDALAHPARIRLFRYIMQSNMHREKVCNKDLVQAFDYAQATISQHVKKLVDSGLLDTKKENKFTFYYVNLGTLQKYITVVKKFD